MNFEKIKMVNLIHLSENEKKMILEWRNHNDVRKWMYNFKLISLQEHLKFIEGLKEDKNNQYFLIKNENENIGVVYFNHIDLIKRNTKFGLYANPNAKIAGIGKILEGVCIQYAFDSLQLDALKLEVFSENLRALNLYKKFNFKETGRKIINDKEVIIMELKNENR